MRFETSETVRVPHTVPQSSATLVIGEPATLADIWLRMPRRLLPYWSAVHWSPPLSVSGAREWFAENRSDCLFVIGAPEPIGFAALTPDEAGKVACYRIVLGFLEERGWMDHGAPVLARLTSLVLTDFNGSKCEWWIPADWQLRRSVAERLGYQLEATYPDACSVDGGYRDLLLLGLVEEEWTGDGRSQRES
jgi:hypothetical protein